MRWKLLPTPGDLPAEWKHKTRFLVDETLGQDAADYLNEKGYNAIFVAEVGLAGHSDEDVFAYAWRERRVLLTQDHDYLDDSEFPEHRNPGVIVLPSGSAGDDAFGFAIGTAIAVFGTGPTIWEKTKITVSGDGYMTIRNRNFDTGRIITTRYRRGARGYETFTEN